MGIQELFALTEWEIKGELKSGEVLAVATSYEWGKPKQQICFQVEGEYWGEWLPVHALQTEHKVETKDTTEHKVETKDTQEQISALAKYISNTHTAIAKKADADIKLFII